MKEEVFHKASNIQAIRFDLERIVDVSDLAILRNPELEFYMRENVVDSQAIHNSIEKANAEIRNVIQKKIAELQAEFDAL